MTSRRTAGLTTISMLAVGLAATSGAASRPTPAPLVAAGGASVEVTCHRLMVVRGQTVRRVARSALRLGLPGGATLQVSVSRHGCAVAAVSVELLNARASAWLSLGSPDIYAVGRLDLACRRAATVSSFRLDPGTATASVELKTEGGDRQTTLQPGQRLKAPAISARASPADMVAWTIQPAGEAGWTTAHIVESAQPGCRTDIRALVTPSRTG